MIKKKVIQWMYIGVGLCIDCHKKDHRYISTLVPRMVCSDCASKAGDKPSHTRQWVTQ